LPSNRAPAAWSWPTAPVQSCWSTARSGACSAITATS
jgi:hypothetical protein